MNELREDPMRKFVATEPARLVALHLSSNQPHVQAGGRSAQPAHAAVVGLQLADGSCEVAVALDLIATREHVIYAGGPMPPAEVPDLLEQALLFAESMGFILDDVGWARMPDDQRRELFARTSIFHPPPEVVLAAPDGRARPKDALAAVARLFAAFAALLAFSLAGCATGMSAEQRTRDAEIHYELGSNAIRTDPRGALREFLIAVQSNPEMPQAHAALGFLYAFSFGEPAKAEEEFRRAIDLDENYSEALVNFGAFYLSRQRYAEAIPLFERALANPLYADRLIAESNLGWAFYKTGQIDKGVQRLKAALAVAPKFCKGWRQLGTIYAETSKLELAVDAMGRYVAACPDTADARLQHAKLLARSSRSDEARGELEKCAKSEGIQADAASVEECRRFLKELGAP